MNIRIKDKRKRQKMKDYFKNTVYGSMYQDMSGGTKVQIGGPRSRRWEGAPLPSRPESDDPEVSMKHRRQYIQKDSPNVPPLIS